MDGQFYLGDHRSLEDVLYELLTDGFIPSFCTACYRLGRTGHDFMDLAKPGVIKNYCQPNALITLKEYLEDYASPKTKGTWKQDHRRTNQHHSAPRATAKAMENLKQVEAGNRDLYFEIAPGIIESLQGQSKNLPPSSHCEESATKQSGVRTFMYIREPDRHVADSSR